MKKFSRRDFLRFSATGMAGVAATANFPFLGRQLALASSGSNFFTIAVISDTQNYTDVTHTQPFNMSLFIDQTQYLANNVSAMNLAFVTHVGDVVQHGDGTNGTPGNDSYGAGQEWLNAKEAMDILNATGVPFGVCPGNHDYDNYSYTGIGAYPPLVSKVYWQEYYGSSSPYFAGKSWYGGASDEVGYISTGTGVSSLIPAGTLCNYGLSSYQMFSAGGKKFLHISLELEAGPNALAWAQGVIDAYPGYATIVTTHAYLMPPAWTDSSAPQAVTASYVAPSFLTNSPGGNNSPANVWADLIAPNEQIFLVLCGHSYTNPAVSGVSKAENILIGYHNSGDPVYQVLTDYQGNTSLLGSGGGDGWYRFMQFDMENNVINFTTYNAYNGMDAGLDLVNNAYAFNQVPAFSDFSLAMPPQVLNSPPQVEVVACDLVYSRATKRYAGNLTLTNTSVNPVTDSVAVALNGLSSGVTLVNTAGFFNGAPYATVSNNGLSAGASLVIPVQFSDPSNARINFTPLVFHV